MRIGVLTAGGDAPGLNAAIRAIGQLAFRDGHELIGIANGWAGLAAEFAGHDLTPADITASGPISTDRPFAGYTYAGLFFQRAHRTASQEFPFPSASAFLDPKSYSSFESLELDIGILGPSSLAENAQEMIHHQFDDPSPNGWGNQLHDEPEFSLKYNRRWRSQAVQPLATIPLAFQAIPEAGAIAGSLQDEVHAGATFRIGYNLPDDFGPGELANPADFTGRTAYTGPSMWDLALEDQSVYIFVRPYGRIVAHSALLQGDNWRHDDPVTANPSPAVFDVQFGIAWRFLKHFEVAYMTTYESPEFTGQHGWDSWASLQLTYSLAW